MADKYANVAHMKVVESAANTLTYKKLETGISLFEKMAWVIARIEYYSIGAGFAAADDGLYMGIFTSNNPSAFSPEQVAIVDMTNLSRVDLGTAASGLLFSVPIIRDFASLPGGGLIVPPNPIYLGVQGVSLSNPTTLEARIYYTAVQLKGDEFWELVEARRIISST